MNTRRLNKLASFLDDLPRKKFYFGEVVRDGDVSAVCGTVCCAMGWAPKVFPRLVEWFRSPYGGRLSIRMLGQDKEGSYVVIASILFDITCEEAARLFSPGEIRPWVLGTGLGRHTAPALVAKSIRRFIEWKRAGGEL